MTETSTLAAGAGGRLAGKTAIISGAAQGMGSVTAGIFAEQGASIVMLDVQAGRGEARAREIGPMAAFVEGDVRREADWA
jgi:3alpha(or 20beta)-hydroxysteroid dehydrogenase